ncbi:MAG: hypothetical protein JWO40_636 [Candidatus Doudnabacteria bacterium]|nr:hypothetical protein [Candidatus Doudnabacteria bacterium]
MQALCKVGIAALLLACLSCLADQPVAPAPRSDAQGPFAGRIRPPLIRPTPMSPKGPDVKPPLPDPWLALSYDQRLADAMVLQPTKIATPIDPISGSPEAVHPTKLYFPNGWHGYKYWKFVTPYLRSDYHYENPSLLVSNDDVIYIPPFWFSNPLVKPVALPNSYNSDPDLSYDPIRDELILIYRYVDQDFNHLMALTTQDGFNWIPWGDILKERNHNAVSQSQSIEPDGNSAKIWYVQSGAAGCVSQNNSVKLVTAQRVSGKSFAQAVYQTGPTVNWQQKGYNIWHAEVRKVSEKFGYLAVYAAYPSGFTCGHNDLFIALSSDGINFETFALPILWRSAMQMNSLYRATAMYDQATDVVTIEYSALDLFDHWHSSWKIAYNWSKLLRTLRATNQSDIQIFVSRTPLPSIIATGGMTDSPAFLKNPP